MTLILTELSEFGIAMAADSAVTHIIDYPGGVGARVYRGAVKLLPVQSLQAGISVWGIGALSGVPIDNHLRNFLHDNRSNYSSLRELAFLLQDELRRWVPDIDVDSHPLGTIGIHLAGFENVGNQQLPTFWHIHNGRSQALPDSNIDPRRINANHDRPPQRYPPGHFYITRNGDFQLYSRVFVAFERLFNSLRQSGFVIPDANTLAVTPLRARAEYLRFQIKTVAEIYKMSNVPVPGSISGEVTTLTLTDSGIEMYWTQ